MSGRLLVTGALGYLGGRISLHLRDRGHKLRLVTRRPPETRPRWSMDLEVARQEADDDAALDRLCRDCDGILHLSATNEIEAAANPAQALIDTSLATLRLIQAAERNGVRRFIYMSTAHVYGAPLAGRIDESTLPRPVHPYAITHRAAEDFVLGARVRGKLRGLVLRLSNAVGGPADPLIDRWTLVANDLCRQVVRERGLTLNSSGLQRRNFIPLGDVCRAVEHFLGLPDTAWGDGLFNLGGTDTLTILELAQLVADRAEATLAFKPLLTRPMPKVGEQSQPLDFTSGRLRATGFAPAGSLAEEIDRTLLLCRDAFGVERTAG
jgi:UDP-glucose 4-epimerase